MMDIFRLPTFFNSSIFQQGGVHDPYGSITTGVRFHSHNGSSCMVMYHVLPLFEYRSAPGDIRLSLSDTYLHNDLTCLESTVIGLIRSDGLVSAAKALLTSSIERAPAFRMSSVLICFSKSNLSLVPE